MVPSPQAGLEGRHPVGPGEGSIPTPSRDRCQRRSKGPLRRQVKLFRYRYRQCCGSGSRSGRIRSYLQDQDP